MKRKQLRSVIAVVLASSATVMAGGTRASAQTSPPNSDQIATVSWGAIDGSVRDVDGASLRGVEIVSVDNSNIHTRSGAGGAFRIDSIPAGPHLIRFRRLGILPLTVSVVVGANSITSVDAVTGPIPLTLSRVTVQAASGELVNLPAGVADRIRAGIGTYLTAAQIDKMHPLETKDIFRHVAGVSVEKLQNTYVVRSTRGVQTINGDGCAAGMAVVLNGAILNNTLNGDAPTNFAGATGVLDAISPRDIAAIEIYKDGAETPANLQDSECGIVYIWTK
ncbi:MAG: carboxypeptidase-like regulatory domain-containing protein [Gemmatimonadaceae bacterium]